VVDVGDLACDPVPVILCRDALRSGEPEAGGQRGVVEDPLERRAESGYVTHRVHESSRRFSEDFRVGGDIGRDARDSVRHALQQTER
jgi:hypothetical protein